jgi:hypothetical protein
MTALTKQSGTRRRFELANNKPSLKLEYFRESVSNLFSCPAELQDAI